jgi:formylglycine-generating enzyme required for sulfatase activity
MRISPGRISAWAGVVVMTGWLVRLSGAAGAEAAADTTNAAPVAELREILATTDSEAVRLAVEDLTGTFGARYPRGADYLARLRALEPALAMARAAGTNEAGLSGAARQILEYRQLSREALLANPLLDFDRVLVLKREFPEPKAARQAMGHALGVGSLNAHTSDTIPRQGQWNDELAVLSGLRGRPTFTTVANPGNRETIIDPVLHFDADRILFAKEGGAEKNWRLFEIGLDGSGLRQVTPDDGADVGHFDPCYLPDGRIIFASTAVYQGLPCEFGGREMVCLYLLDRRTGDIRQLTFEQDSDWCPTMLPNGRVLYQRWEYTDQSHANSRMLFHMNPDGTDQREFRGSGSWFPGSFFYARAIPGHPHQVIGVAGGHHGTPRSGRLLIFDPSQGRHDGEGIVQEIPGRGRRVEPIVRDRLVDGVWPQFLMPWPLSTKYHLVAAKLRPDALWGIYLADVFDNLTLLKEVEGAALLWPSAVRKVEKPPAIPDRVNLQSDQATVFITDLHRGPGLKGVPRGTVKKLRVIEYYFSRRGFGGLYGTLGLDGPWDVKRVLGTVPVEADGSAHFRIPANTPLSLQPLDEKGQALQLMRSWFVGLPGEAVSCAGCHEPQDEVSFNQAARAARRAPSAIEPWHGPARGFSFVREVQPVLDRHCVPCHDGQARADGLSLPLLQGGIMLTNWTSQLAGRWDGGGRFTQSYFELQRFVRRPGIEGDRRMFTPLDYHFSATELGQILRKGHHDVTLDAEAWERLATWVDLNAPFYGTWGEIPQFCQDPAGAQRLAAVSLRAMALRRRYVPMGPHPDYEAIPPTAFHEPAPEAGQNHVAYATWICPQRFMGGEQVREEQGASHDPPLSRPAATLSPLGGERAGRGGALGGSWSQSAPILGLEASPESTPVKPAPEPEGSVPAPQCPGWPFLADEAVRRQKETGPPGAAGRLAIPLREHERQSPAAGRFVRVAAGPSRWLSLAEAQVFSGGTNVALGKRATQSSTWGGAGAERAADGRTDGAYDHGSITHTGDGRDEWWEVDLGAVYPVERMVLWNRTDCAGERLSGVTVTLLDEQRNPVWSARTDSAIRERYVLHTAHDTTLRFVWIPPGEFVMGSADGHPDQRPPQRVRIGKGFWLGSCEIRNEEFRQFMPGHESRTEDRHGYQFGALGYDQDQPDQPAVRVSWAEAMAFCRWLSQKTGRKITLPTEAQWEWACRAGSASPFWYGGLDTDFSPFANLGDRTLKEFAADTALDDYSSARPMVNPNCYDDWIPHDDRFDDGGFVTEPSGRYKPNPWGLHDMHGNAWEWTRSAGRPYPYREDDGRNDLSAAAAGRVVRGGSWYDRPKRCTSSFRLTYPEFQKVFNVGFRVVCEE